jgi:MFS family permease
MTDEASKYGFRTFGIIWVGQLISLIGSALTSFCLSVWILQNTLHVTNYTVAIVLASLPGTLFAPIAGALVDKWNRRLVMIGSDIAPAVVTIVLAWMLYQDNLQTWHIYIGVVVGSLAQTFQWPAYVASITLLVPRAQYARVNGMIQASQAVVTIGAPALAGLLLSFVSLSNILVIDFVTFLFAVTTLAIVRIPQPPESEAGRAAKGSMWHQIKFAWRYIRERPGLFNLLLFFAVVNLAGSVTGVALMPMVLGFASTAGVGTIMSLVGVGTLTGGLLMSITGGPKKKIYGVLGAAAMYCVCFVMIGLRPSIWLVGAGVALWYAVLPVMNACSQAIWMSKVEPDLQGRVFSMRRMIAQGTVPIGDFSAGPLADRVFNPMLMAGGALAGSVGTVVGVGPGRGIGLMFLVMAIVPGLAAVWGFMNPRVRNVEEELPDHSASPPSKSETTETKDVATAEAATAET